MSEADAEDGPHGLDAYLDGKNEGTTLDLHFEPPLRPSKAKPDRAPFRPIQFKNASPAKKKKHGEAETGRWRSAESARRWRHRVGMRAERTMWYQATTRAARAS